MKKQELIIGIIAIIIVVLFLKGVKDSIKNLFGTFGLGTTVEEDKTEGQIEKTEKKANQFSPLFWQKAPKGKTSQLFKQALTDRLINDIEDGIGFFYDSPEKILGAFRMCQYQSQVSWLAYNWQKKHGSDLQAWLSDRLDTDKQREAYLEILSITKNLPTGFLKQK